MHSPRTLHIGQNHKPGGITLTEIGETHSCLSEEQLRSRSPLPVAASPSPPIFSRAFVAGRSNNCRTNVLPQSHLPSYWLPEMPPAPRLAAGHVQLVLLVSQSPRGSCVYGWERGSQPGRAWELCLGQARVREEAVIIESWEGGVEWEQPARGRGYREGWGVEPSHPFLTPMQRGPPSCYASLRTGQAEPPPRPGTHCCWNNLCPAKGWKNPDQKHLYPSFDSLRSFFLEAQRGSWGLL